MKHNRAQKDILYIFISSFILVAAWISFNIHHIWVTSSVTEEVQVQLEPISPNFDTTVIQQLRTRQKVSPLNEVKNLPISTTPTPIPEASTSASIQPISSINKLP